MLKFQAVAEKTAKNFRELFFAAPCTPVIFNQNSVEPKGSASICQRFRDSPVKKIKITWHAKLRQKKP